MDFTCILTHACNFMVQLITMLHFAVVVYSSGTQQWRQGPYEFVVAVQTQAASLHWSHDRICYLPGLASGSPSVKTICEAGLIYM